ncbi:MAG: substrate-binding domain-containing protein [Planctomycetota bacterium]
MINKQNNTVSSTIKVLLAARIDSVWGSGSKIPSLRTLSNEIGINYVNTQKAALELVDEGLLKAVPRVGIFVPEKIPSAKLSAYRKLDLSDYSSPADRPLAGMKLGLVYKSEPDTFHLASSITNHVINGFQESINGQGLEIVKIDPDKENLYSNTSDKRVELNLKGYADLNAIAVVRSLASIIKINQGQVISLVGSLRKAKITPESSSYDEVIPDYHQGAFTAGKYLTKLKKNNICYLGRRNIQLTGDVFDEPGRDRLTSFEEGLGEKIPEEKYLIADSYGMTPGAEVVRDYLNMNPRPDTVFAAVDELAIGFILGLIAHDILPGRDYSIIGFDGYLPGREIVNGGLTTIDLPVKEIGRTAGKLIIERMLKKSLSTRIIKTKCSLFEGKTIEC